MVKKRDFLQFYKNLDFSWMNFLRARASKHIKRWKWKSKSTCCLQISSVEKWLFSIINVVFSEIWNVYSNHMKSNQIKSNQIKSNQNKTILSNITYPIQPWMQWQPCKPLRPFPFILMSEGRSKQSSSQHNSQFTIHFIFMYFSWLMCCHSFHDHWWLFCDYLDDHLQEHNHH